MSILHRIRNWLAPAQPRPKRGPAWVQLDYDVPTDDYVQHLHNAARRFLRPEFVTPTVMTTIHLEPFPGHWGDLQQRKERFMNLLTAPLPNDPMFGERSPDDVRESDDIRRAIAAGSIAFFDAKRQDGRRFVGILVWDWKE